MKDLDPVVVEIIDSSNCVILPCWDRDCTSVDRNSPSVLQNYPCINSNMVAIALNRPVVINDGSDRVMRCRCIDDFEPCVGHGSRQEEASHDWVFRLDAVATTTDVVAMVDQRHVWLRIGRWDEDHDVA